MAVDIRFGIAEYRYSDMLLLGFPADGRYHAHQHDFQEAHHSCYFLRPSDRAGGHCRWCWTSWNFAGRESHCTGGGKVNAGMGFKIWVDEEGWVKEDALYHWAKNHPGKNYIVGNELI